MTTGEIGRGVVAPAAPAPLGRYARPDAPPDDGRLHTVQLLNLPIALFLRTREHHDDLIREFTLMAIQREHSEAPAMSDRLSDLVETLGRRYGASAGRADAVRGLVVRRSVNGPRRAGQERGWNRAWTSRSRLSSTRV